MAYPTREDAVNPLPKAVQLATKCCSELNISLIFLDEVSEVIYNSLYEPVKEDGWHCICGEFNKSEWHCASCLAQPPQGCDCGVCRSSIDPIDDELYYFIC